MYYLRPSLYISNRLSQVLRFEKKAKNKEMRHDLAIEAKRPLRMIVPKL